LNIIKYLERVLHPVEEQKHLADQRKNLKN
jgi:hypothetical protein